MFTRDDMLNLLNAQPFNPIRFYLSDGGTVDVRHREFVIPMRRYAIVGIPGPSNGEDKDRFTLLYYMHVTRTEALLPGQPPDGPPPSSPPQSPVGTPS